MNAVSERFQKLIDDLGISYLAFDREAKLSSGLSQKYSKGTGVSAESAGKIFARYPDLSAEWLFKGEGPMWLVKENLRESEPLPKLNVPRIITMDQGGRENILMVNSKAFAGYSTNIQEAEYITELPAMSIPLPQFRNGTFRAFQAKGASMEPTIYNGDWCIGRWVDNWISNLRNGRIYIIVTHETILVKRVLNRLVDGKLVIQSDNPSFATDFIEAEEIVELWYLVFKFSNMFPNTRYDVASKISELEADVEMLKRNFGVSKILGNIQANAHD